VQALLFDLSLFYYKLLGLGVGLHHLLILLQRHEGEVVRAHGFAIDTADLFDRWQVARLVSSRSI
jgi:hypothetical protein